MAGFNEYVEKNSPLVPFGAGFAIFGLAWTAASFTIKDSWWFAILIAGLSIFLLSVICLLLGLRSNLKPRKKR